MPSYYNPNNFYPATYPMSWQNYMMPNNSMAQNTGNQMLRLRPIEWVDGEIGARAFQMPQGLEADVAIPLWDNSEPYIYFKSWNRMGMPNPLQKIKYDPTPIQDSAQPMLPSGNSGSAGQANNNQNGNSGVSGAVEHDMSQYVTKDDLNSMKEELKSMLAAQNQSHAANSGNTGGNNVNGGNRGDRR